MKTLRIILLPLILLALQPAASSADKPQQWEYKIFSYKGSLEGVTAKENVSGGSPTSKGDPIARRMEEALNKMGTEGWELCAESNGVLIFKRAKAG